MGTCCCYCYWYLWDCDCFHGRNLDEDTKYIDRMLSMNTEEDCTKLLLLGPGDSGRSTLFKQLILLYDAGFSKEDALILKEHIYCQIICEMKSILRRLIHDNIYNDNIYNDNTLQIAINTVINHENVTTFPVEISNAIQYIWKNDKRMKNIFDIGWPWSDQCDAKILHETTEYFWNEIDRIKDPEYIPNERDIINVSYRTTGVIEKKFIINGIQNRLHIFDVGGQKSERKKWINCFHDVHTLVFMTSLSCFNEMMFEDFNKNRMVDSLELFDSVCNCEYLKDSNIILLLNKKDLFERKIKNIPINICPAFDDFDEFLMKYRSVIFNICTVFCAKNVNMRVPMDIKNLIVSFYGLELDFIKHKFQSLNQNPNRKIIIHCINAHNGRDVEQWFNDIIQILTKPVYQQTEITYTKE